MFVNKVYTTDSEAKDNVKAKDNVEAKDDQPTLEDRYFKLPYVGRFSRVVQNKMKELVNEHCKGIKVNLVFSPYKIGQCFSPKGPIP